MGQALNAWPICVSGAWAFFKRTPRQYWFLSGDGNNAAPEPEAALDRSPRGVCPGPARALGARRGFQTNAAPVLVFERPNRGRSGFLPK